MPGPVRMGDGVGAIDSAVRLLAEAVEHSPLGMALTTVDRSRQTGVDPRAVVVNQALADMLGYTPDGLRTAIGQGAVTHSDDRVLERAHLARLEDGSATSAQWEKRYLHRDGHLVWGRVSASLVRATDGTPLWLVAQIEDVTRRRRSEKALAKAQTELLEKERRTARELRQALDSRLIIEQAKGFLAATYDISVDAAFARLRDYARHNQTKIGNVCDAVVNHGFRP